MVKARRGAPRCVPTGIDGFDDAAGGGLPAGMVTVVLGGAGAGKTIFASQFLALGENAGEAFLLCEDHPEPIDLLFTDVVPSMSGSELAKRLAPIKPGMKVLYTSGHADSSRERQQMPDPAFFLAKPITPHALLRKVREVLDAP